MADSIPKFCAYCGGKMLVDREYKEPWSDRAKCEKCGVWCLIEYGDQMGGAPFCVVEWMPRGRV